MKTKSAIFFTGGGARGAYQAGVVKALAEIAPNHEMPVDILSGVSAGAINAAFIAAYADFQQGVRKLLQVWSQMSCGQVFEVGNMSLIRSVCRTSAEIVMRNTPEDGHYLLNTEPLRHLIESNINFNQINRNIEKGILEGFVVTALNYATSETISFYNTKHPVKKRTKFRYNTNKTNITSDHIMASSAIPLFFPPIKIDGVPYGDGSFRNNHPLRTIISMGIDKVIIVGINHDDTQEELKKKDKLKNGVSFGKLFSMVFNSIFHDNIEIDIETLNYINNNIDPLQEHEKEKIPFRHIDYIYLRPTADIGPIALEMEKRLPKLLRYLLGGFGSSGQSSDLISYLMFEAEYCHELIIMGYQDTMNRKDELEHFFFEQSVNSNKEPVQAS